MVGLLILIPVLHSVRWDGANWSWAIVFIPAWFVQAIVYAAQMSMIFSDPTSNEDENGEPAHSARVKTNEERAQHMKKAIPQATITTILFACIVIFQAFLSARLDETITWSWFAVIVPWLLFEVVLMIWRVYGARQALIDLKRDLETLRAQAQARVDAARSGNDPENPEHAPEAVAEAEAAIFEATAELETLRVSKFYLIQAWFWPSVRFITAFLLAGRANNSYPGSYFISAIPIIFASIVYPYLEALDTHAQNRDTTTVSGLICYYSMQTYSMLLIWLLAMGKLDNKSIYSGFAVWAPYFFLCGVIFLNMTFILCINPEDLLQQQGAGGAGAAAGANGGAGTTQEAKTDGDQVPIIVTAPPPAVAEQEKANVIILT